MGKKFMRIGVIGTGGIAGAHVGNMAKTKREDYAVTAAADNNPKTLAAFADNFRIEKRYSDWKKLVADKDIDAVTICTPNFLHAEPAIAALRAGKHVMVEKPMAMNAKEAALMCEAARKTGAKLQIGFQFFRVLLWGQDFNMVNAVFDMLAHSLSS